MRSCKNGFLCLEQLQTIRACWVPPMMLTLGLTFSSGQPHLLRWVHQVVTKYSCTVHSIMTTCTQLVLSSCAALSSSAETALVASHSCFAWCDTDSFLMPCTPSLPKPMPVPLEACCQGITLSFPLCSWLCVAERGQCRMMLMPLMTAAGGRAVSHTHSRCASKSSPSSAPTYFQSRRKMCELVLHGMGESGS